MTFDLELLRELFRPRYRILCAIPAEGAHGMYQVQVWRWWCPVWANTGFAFGTYTRAASWLEQQG